MQVGDLHVDMRDEFVVKILRILPARERVSPIVEVFDIMRRCDYSVDAKHLSPRAVDPGSVWDWIKAG